MNIEIRQHNRNTLSIKDNIEGIDISSKKWDFIFDYLLDNCIAIYFFGKRLDDKLCVIKALTNINAEILIGENDDFNILFLQVKKYIFLNYRKELNDIWISYEYPAIVFAINYLSFDNIFNYFKKYKAASTFDTITKNNDNTYILYRSNEDDVLWLIKSDNLPNFRENIIIM